jgi:hypothetical protein
VQRVRPVTNFLLQLLSGGGGCGGLFVQRQ